MYLLPVVLEVGSPSWGSLGSAGGAGGAVSLLEAQGRKCVPRFQLLVVPMLPQKLLGVLPRCCTRMLASWPTGTVMALIWKVYRDSVGQRRTHHS